MKNTDPADIKGDREIMAAAFHRRAKALAERRTKESKEDNALLVLVFTMGKERYAATLSELSEVLPFTNYAPIPKSDRSVCGVINVRGELHTVLELSVLLGLEHPLEDEGGYVLILKKNGVGLRVQQLDEILSCPDTGGAKEKRQPHWMPAQFSRTILEENILLLDMDKLLSHPVFIRE